MDYVIGTILVVDAYVLIYYRLLVRHFLGKDDGVAESGFFALLAPPPLVIASPRARKYAKRFYAALAVLVLCVLAIAWRQDFRFMPTAG